MKKKGSVDLIHSQNRKEKYVMLKQKGYEFWILLLVFAQGFVLGHTLSLFT